MLWVARALCKANFLPCGEELEQSLLSEPAEGSYSFGLRVVLVILDVSNFLNIPYHKAM